VRRVRFAPSPTGTLHVGKALSAVANRSFGDRLLLRIDDNDAARNVPGGEQAILDDLEWLGVGWDEGPVRQSERGGRYREAVERLGRTRMRPAMARAHLLYGEWLRRENRHRDARAELRTAHGLFTTMGIEAFAERARRELLATGDTVRKRTVETVSELTAQEAHIARLAASGRTNVEIGAQLFLSTRTVEWHLSKVYTKLGVGSRRELRRALASLGQAGPQA